jgi:hypothetical protein
MLYRSVILCETIFITWIREHNHLYRYIIRSKFNISFGLSAIIGY